MSDNEDEIVSFITEGTHRLATISTNDYGILLSARMAQTYLLRALQLLESKRSADTAMRMELKALKSDAASIAEEYAQLEAYSLNCERFHHLKTKGRIEWLSKLVVSVITSGHLGSTRHLLAHKIQVFHTRVCSVLLEK